MPGPNGGDLYIEHMSPAESVENSQTSTTQMELIGQPWQKTTAVYSKPTKQLEITAVRSGFIFGKIAELNFLNRFLHEFHCHSEISFRAGTNLVLKPI
jgi:hypothetical protein